MKFVEKYKDLFESQIIYRGKEYYKNGNVKKLYKDNKHYTAMVEGSELNKYEVDITQHNNEIEMYCTCPYDENCKHEYATLMAIDDKKYNSGKLLPVSEDEDSLKGLIENIPENELRAYILDSIKSVSHFSAVAFLKNFEKYMPEKTREYFYNTLYNDFLLDKPKQNLEKFIELAKNALENKNYHYSFLIVSLIIDAEKESKYEDYDGTFMEQYAILGMFIRISYRKGNKKVKSEIKEWINKIADKDYYNDIYLEDMILTVKE